MWNSCSPLGLLSIRSKPDPPSYPFASTHGSAFCSLSFSATSPLVPDPVPSPRFKRPASFPMLNFPLLGFDALSCSPLFAPTVFAGLSSRPTPFLSALSYHPVLPSGLYCTPVSTGTFMRSYSRKEAWTVLATRLACVRMTAFGRPEVPELKQYTAASCPDTVLLRFSTSARTLSPTAPFARML